MKHEKKLKAGLICAGLLVCILAGLWFRSGSKSLSDPPVLAPEPKPIPTIDRQISYSFTVKNTTGKVVADAGLWVFAPVKQTPTQVCRKIDSSHAYTLIRDSRGNQVLYYSFDVIPPYGSKIVSITANLELSTLPRPVELADKTFFLSPGQKVESNHPDIVRAAEKLRAGKTLETLRKTFDWVAGTMKYTGYVSQDRGALYALKHKKGDCTEYMNLFAALCRANAVPARCMAGFVCPENRVLKPSGFHNWAEVYHDGTWQNVDPQGRRFMEDQFHYISTRIITDTPDDNIKPFHRFRFKGDGLKVQMNT